MSQFDFGYKFITEELLSQQWVHSCCLRVCAQNVYFYHNCGVAICRTNDESTWNVQNIIKISDLVCIKKQQIFSVR